MRNKKEFLKTINGILEFNDGATKKEIATIINACAKFAEENTNPSGDYDVGADIACMLRELKTELCGEI